MTTRRDSVEEMFEAALALKLEDRSAYLDEVGKSDPALRQLVEELLSVDAKVGRFLEHPPLGSFDKAITPGTKIGQYEIVSLIGSGGMGEGVSCLVIKASWMRIGHRMENHSSSAQLQTQDGRFTSSTSVPSGFSRCLTP